MDQQRKYQLKDDQDGDYEERLGDQEDNKTNTTTTSTTTSTSTTSPKVVVNLEKEK